MHCGHNSSETEAASDPITSFCPVLQQHKHAPDVMHALAVYVTASVHGCVPRLLRSNTFSSSRLCWIQLEEANWATKCKIIDANIVRPGEIVYYPTGVGDTKMPDEREKPSNAGEL